jgi:hypothetical protein
LILTLGVALTADSVVRALVGVMGPRAGVVQYAILILPVALLASNWATHDESANTAGERFAAQVFAALPEDAVLVTYWDALTTLSYKHCVEGVRPDVSLRAYDEFALVTCDPIPSPLTEVVKRRPVYALMVFPNDLRRLTGLDPIPTDTTVRLPYGKRFAQFERLLYQLVPIGSVP